MAKKKSKKWRSGEKPRKRNLKGLIVSKMQEFHNKTESELVAMFQRYRDDTKETFGFEGVSDGSLSGAGLPGEEPDIVGVANLEKEPPIIKKAIEEHGDDFEHILIELSLGKITSGEAASRVCELVYNGGRDGWPEAEELADLAESLKSVAHGLDLAVTLIAVTRILRHRMSRVSEDSRSDDFQEIELNFRNMEDIEENMIQLRERFPGVPEDEFNEIRQVMIARLPSKARQSPAGESD